MKHFVVKHEVTSDFLVSAVQDALDVRKKHNPAWVSEGALSLTDELLDLVENCGVGNSSSPFAIVDNYLINGDFISREDDKDLWGIDIDFDFENEAEKWFEFCNEGDFLFFNDDYACRSF